MKAGEKGMKNMIASLSHTGDERRAAGRDFASFEEDHSNDPQK
jgi:hypothetical protein